VVGLLLYRLCESCLIPYIFFFLCPCNLLIGLPNNFPQKGFSFFSYFLVGLDEGEIKMTHGEIERPREKVR
jgi:hypothetical protein